MLRSAATELDSSDARHMAARAAAPGARAQHRGGPRRPATGDQDLACKVDRSGPRQAGHNTAPTREAAGHRSGAGPQVRYSLTGSPDPHGGEPREELVSPTVSP